MNNSFSWQPSETTGKYLLYRQSNWLDQIQFRIDIGWLNGTITCQNLRDSQSHLLLSFHHFCFSFTRVPFLINSLSASSILYRSNASPFLQIQSNQRRQIFTDENWLEKSSRRLLWSGRLVSLFGVNSFSIDFQNLGVWSFLGGFMRNHLSSDVDFHASTLVCLSIHVCSIFGCSVQRSDHFTIMPE